MGVLTAFRSAGGALGVLILTALGDLRRRGAVLLIALFLFGVFQMFLGVAPNFPLALLFVTLINVNASIADVLHQSLLQLSVSNEQRGRAMGSWIVGIGSAPAGHLEVGYMAELTDARTAFLNTHMAGGPRVGPPIGPAPIAVAAGA